MVKGELEDYNLEGPVHWTESFCPVCGKKYYHSVLYKPRTCLELQCIKTAKEVKQNEEDNPGITDDCDPGISHSTGMGSGQVRVFSARW